MRLNLLQPSKRPWLSSEETEPPPIQQEVPAQPAQPPEEVEPFPVQLEAPTQAPEFPDEDITPIPASDELGAGPVDWHQAHSDLPSVTFHLVDVELTITPEPTVESPTSRRRPHLLRRQNSLQLSKRPQLSLQSLLQRLSLLRVNRNHQFNLLSLMGKLNLQPRRRPQPNLQGPLVRQNLQPSRKPQLILQGR